MQDYKPKTAKNLFFSYVCVFFFIGIDQLTKYFAAAALKENAPLVLIPGVFELRYLENQSAAFSVDLVSILHKIFHIVYFDENPNAFLWCKMAFFVFFTLLVVVFLILCYRKIPWNRHYLMLNLITLGFIAGAAGNLIDRLCRQYVIDFFYFRLINFPIFNVADIYVTLATFGLIVAILFVYEEDEFGRIFPSRRKGDS